MPNIANIQFLGASQTVTGAKYHLNALDKNILIDCGMFQGVKSLRNYNWEPLPIDVANLDYILLTHGHLDHVGYLPRLIKQGFKGVILATAPTLAIAKIILLDSAKIQEEMAKKANEEGFSKHKPALPLYTIDEAEKIIKHFEQVNEGEWVFLAENIKCRFMYNGHIIGSSYLDIDIEAKRFVFSGDLGRENDILLHESKKPLKADYLFVESTYGDKIHPKEDVKQILCDLIHTTLKNKGNLLIPSFAVERLQVVMLLLWELFLEGRIPYIPTFIDSPMGSNVLKVFEKFPDWHQLSKSSYREMCNHFNIIESYADTWNTIDDKRAKIVIAGSGMITGGRILTYIQQLIDEDNTTVLLVGYQADGTRGRKLLDGVKEIKFFGKRYLVKADIHYIESLSAHADQNGLMNWIKQIKNTPVKVFIIHGETEASEALCAKIESELNWEVIIPKLFEKYSLKL